MVTVVSYGVKRLLASEIGTILVPVVPSPLAKRCA